MHQNEKQFGKHLTYFCLCLFLFFSTSVVAEYGGGTGLPDDPFQIATREHLLHLSDDPCNWDKAFVLVADIDLDPCLPGGQIFDAALIAPDTSSSTGFQGLKFTGSFDGYDPNAGVPHIIRNLTIHDHTGRSYLGLFGSLRNADIAYLSLENVSIIAAGDGSNNIGSLTGYQASGTIANCSMSGRVIAGPECDSVGGLTGSTSGTILSCFATGLVSAGEHGVYIGLLSGDQYGSASLIDKCFAAGQVTGGESSQQLGGLTGGQWGGTLTRSYAEVDVTGDNIIGGLVGFQSYYGTITNCYATGDVSGNTFIGGLIGYQYGIYHTSQIEKCYAVGEVSGTESVGGFMGHKSGKESIITDCFWDTQATGQTTSAGGAGVNGLSTAEMLTDQPFLGAGWDFVDETNNGSDDVWAMPTETTGYPLLCWQNNPDGTVPDENIDLHDIALVGKSWLQTDNEPGFNSSCDLDENGTIDLNDLSLMLERWLENSVT